MFYVDYDALEEYSESKKKPIRPIICTGIAADYKYSSVNTVHNRCEKALDE